MGRCSSSSHTKTKVSAGTYKANFLSKCPTGWRSTRHNCHPGFREHIFHEHRGWYMMSKLEQIGDIRLKVPPQLHLIVLCMSGDRSLTQSQRRTKQSHMCGRKDAGVYTTPSTTHRRARLWCYRRLPFAGAIRFNVCANNAMWNTLGLLNRTSKQKVALVVLSWRLRQGLLAGIDRLVLSQFPYSQDLAGGGIEEIRAG